MRGTGTAVQRLRRRLPSPHGKGRHIGGREGKKTFVYQPFQLRAPGRGAERSARLPDLKKYDPLHRAAGAPVKPLVKTTGFRRAPKVKERPAQRDDAALRGCALIRHISRELTAGSSDKQRPAPSPAARREHSAAGLKRVRQNNFFIYDIKRVKRKKSGNGDNQNKYRKPALNRPLRDKEDQRGGKR